MHLEIARILMIYGSDTNWRDISGRSPLFYAVQNKDIDMIVLLIGNNSSCFAIDNFQQALIPLINIDTFQRQKKIIPAERQTQGSIKFPTDVDIPIFNSFKSHSYDVRHHNEICMNQVIEMVHRGKGYQLSYRLKHFQKV